MTTPLTPEQFEERLDEILTRLENGVCWDAALRVTQHKSGRSPKSTHAEAKAALRALLAEGIGGDEYVKYPAGELKVRQERGDMFHRNQFRAELRKTFGITKGGE